MKSAAFELAGAARYATLREQLREAGASSVQDGAVHLSELELQSLWFAGALGRQFVTTAGQQVEVTQFGHWNHSAGPDFTDAAVCVDGKEVQRGAIELDPDVRDWERHGHGENPQYEDVVLHVFFETGPEQFYTRTLNHREVPQVRLELENFEELGTHSYVPADAHLGRCSYTFTELDDGRIHTLLEAAAQFRLERKAKRLNRVREIHGIDQALFQGLAEALGYRNNALPMRVLSQRAPLSLLQTRDGTQAIDALLFGLAGFLEGERHVESDSESTTAYQCSLWSLWWQDRNDWAPLASRPLPWMTVGVRPQNHPQRRLGALTHLVARWKQLASQALGAQFDLKLTEDFLTGLTHPYWNQHYTLRAASAKPLALIGASRARDIVANQILPLRFQDDPQATWSTYQSLSASQSNEKIKRATIRLFGEHPRQRVFLKKAYHQQALLQIYDDFCLEDDSGCVHCPFPEQLWKMNDATND